MLLWFLGTALVSVWYVFTDPRFDYRLLLLGAVIPDVVDLPFGRSAWPHSLAVAVATLALVMLTTAGRKPVRRLLLGLPIGMLLHLVWDGAFASTTVFWWPFGGGWGHTPVPSVDRPWVLSVLMEVAGAAMLIWARRRFGLGTREAWVHFVRSGVLVESWPSM